MPEMQRITIRLSRRDLERLDAVRGRTGRSKYPRLLLRRAADDVPDPDEEDGGQVVSDEQFERLRALTLD